MAQFDDSQLYRLLNTSSHPEITCFLNRYGIDSVDRDGRTFLMTAVVENKIEVVKHLFELGCSCHLQDGQGLTALHFAAMYDLIELVALLISHGALVDSEDNEGNTPLWRAAMSSDGMTASMKLLMAAGADPTKKNKHGVASEDLFD